MTSRSDRPAVALEASPPAEELLAAKAYGMTWRMWVDSGKPRHASANISPATVKTPRPFHPYRSKWEWRYAQRLDFELAIGLITEWGYETERLEIGIGAVYTPDFPVTLCDGTREMREVKGFWREAGIVRIKAAAKQYPVLRFVLVTYERGEWVRKTIGVKP